VKDEPTGNSQKVWLDGQRDGIVLSNVPVQETGLLGVVTRSSKGIAVFVNLCKYDSVLIDVFDDFHVGETPARL
jgi:cell shape-determining protein MreC